MTVPTYLPWHSPIAYDPRPCVADEQRELTYAELAEEAEAVAEQLAEHGVDRGSVVALALPNQVELLVAMVAAWRLGAVAAPIDPTLTALEAERQVVASGAAAVIAAEDTTAGTGRQVITAARLRRTRLGTRLSAPATDLDEPALVIHTSGSTGQPKGIVLTHGNLAEMTRSLVTHLQITLRDHYLLALPAFHRNVIGATFLAPLSVGGRVSMLRHDARALLDAIERLHPTYLSGTPTTYSSLLAALHGRMVDTSSLRIALCGGASVATEVLEAAEAALGCPLVAGYGLAESTFAATANPIDDRRAGTAGVALPGQQVAIMDTHGGILPPGECGEIVLRGRAVMQGYLADPEATALALGDGWLHTGDAGALDQDGFLHLFARLGPSARRRTEPGQLSRARW